MRPMLSTVLVLLALSMSAPAPTLAQSRGLLGVNQDASARASAHPARAEAGASIEFRIKAGRLVAGKLVSGMKLVAFNNDLDIQIDEVASSLFEKLYQVRARGSALGVLALKAYIQTTSELLRSK